MTTARTTHARRPPGRPRRPEPMTAEEKKAQKELNARIFKIDERKERESFLAGHSTHLFGKATPGVRRTDKLAWVFEFIADLARLGRGIHPQAFARWDMEGLHVPFTDLFTLYQNWAYISGKPGDITVTMFSRYMKEIITARRYRPMDEKGKRPVWYEFPSRIAIIQELKAFRGVYH